MPVWEQHSVPVPLNIGSHVHYYHNQMQVSSPVVKIAETEMARKGQY
jgi:hypothetical protein